MHITLTLHFYLYYSTSINITSSTSCTWMMCISLSLFIFVWQEWSRPICVCIQNSASTISPFPSYTSHASHLPQSINGQPPNQLNQWGGYLPTNSINEEAANPPPLPLYKGAWQPTPSSLALISHSPLLSTPLLCLISFHSLLFPPLPHTLLLHFPTKMVLPLLPWPAIAMASHQDEALPLPQAHPHHESLPLLLLPNLRWFNLLFFSLHC